MNHAEWLAKNSIDCQPLGARISLAQCKANHGHTYACEDCPHGGVKFVGPPKVTKKARDKAAPVMIDEIFMTPEPVLPDQNTQINVVDTQKYEPTEEIMAEKKSYVYRGTCATCKRPDLKLSKTGGDCGRCAWRRKNGQDPLATDLRSPAKSATKTAQEPAAPAAAITPPLVRKKHVQAPADPDTCTIDVIQVLDDAWLSQRVDIVRRLNDSKGDCSRLALAISVVERIKQLGV